MNGIRFPRMLPVRQVFPASAAVDIPGALRRGFEGLRPRIRPGSRIAVGVGSRGIADLPPIVAGVLEQLKAAGAQPFIIPAMGSHGGATPEGQTEILAAYGLTEAQLGVPIRAAMEVEPLGKSRHGLEVLCSREALRSEGIVLVNRVKPHTDFRSDRLGSGLLKMLVIGLGKHAGAAIYHRAALRLGFEPALRELAQVVLQAAPILAGVAIVEDQRHHTARLEVLPREQLESREPELFAQAQRLMPRLPFEEIDLLIVDRLGKNVSGSGMDPNIIGREMHGYSTLFEQQQHLRPSVKRIFVRGLTPETRGNAIGIGLADFTTNRLVRAMDPQKTYVNSLTSLSLNCAKVPIHFETDREALAHALHSLALPEGAPPKIIRIANTLDLDRLELSEAYAPSLPAAPHLQPLGPPEDMRFDPQGNLTE
jgi:hypothetical protein